MGRMFRAVDKPVCFLNASLSLTFTSFCFSQRLKSQEIILKKFLPQFESVHTRDGFIKSLECLFNFLFFKYFHTILRDSEQHCVVEELYYKSPFLVKMWNIMSHSIALSEENTKWIKAFYDITLDSYYFFKSCIIPVTVSWEKLMPENWFLIETTCFACLLISFNINFNEGFAMWPWMLKSIINNKGV